MQRHAGGIFESINTRLRTRIRVATGKRAQPSAGIIDSTDEKDLFKYLPDMLDKDEAIVDVYTIKGVEK